MTVFVIIEITFQLQMASIFMRYIMIPWCSAHILLPDGRHIPYLMPEQSVG